jgi:hypothetical protein
MGSVYAINLLGDPKVLSRIASNTFPNFAGRFSTFARLLFDVRIIIALGLVIKTAPADTGRFTRSLNT